MHIWRFLEKLKVISLHESGLFYIFRDRHVIKAYPSGVIAYLVYKSEEEWKIIEWSFNLKEGNVLEVVTSDYKRRFFKLCTSGYKWEKYKFVLLKFPEEDEDKEGEDILKKHFGLWGFPCIMTGDDYCYQREMEAEELRKSFQLIKGGPFSVWEFPCTMAEDYEDYEIEMRSKELRESFQLIEGGQ